MRRRAFMLVVACFVASLPFATWALAVDDMRVSGPIVHDNLAIYLLCDSTARGAVPLTLEEALAKGSVKVRETGNVNELIVENVGNDEVFVQAGDIVKGGRQDRVLSVDLLLPSHSGELPIAAFCVESGRWSARGGEDAQQFSAAAAAMPSHDAKLAMQAYAAASVSTLPVTGDLNSHGLIRANPASRQEQIWATVSNLQGQLSRSIGAPVSAPASPSSLQLTLESEKLKQAQATYIMALQDKGEVSDDFVGYVFAINGKISGGDAYASNKLFRKMWRKQLSANVTEAISMKDKADITPPPVGNVKAFLAAAEAGVKAERVINANVRLATLDGDASFYAETRRADGGWVHRSYLAK